MSRACAKTANRSIGGLYDQVMTKSELHAQINADGEG
jgi:hypothetical protein